MGWLLCRIFWLGCWVLTVNCTRKEDGLRGQINYDVGYYKPSKTDISRQFIVSTSGNFGFNCWHGTDNIIDPFQLDSSSKHSTIGVRASPIINDSPNIRIVKLCSFKYDPSKPTNMVAMGFRSAAVTGFKDHTDTCSLLYDANMFDAQHKNGILYLKFKETFATPEENIIRLYSGNVQFNVPTPFEAPLETPNPPTEENISIQLKYTSGVFKHFKVSKMSLFKSLFNTRWNFSPNSSKWSLSIPKQSLTVSWNPIPAIPVLPQHMQRFYPNKKQVQVVHLVCEEECKIVKAEGGKGPLQGEVGDAVAYIVQHNSRSPSGKSSGIYYSLVKGDRRQPKGTVCVIVVDGIDYKVGFPRWSVKGHVNVAYRDPKNSLNDGSPPPSALHGFRLYMKLGQ